MLAEIWGNIITRKRDAARRLETVCAAGTIYHGGAGSAEEKEKTASLRVSV